MDGNGRWAKGRGGLRIFGHKSAIVAVRDTIEACAELGIQYLTLYAFSTENWQRPPAEVKALMKLLLDTLQKETPTLLKNDIRLAAIGNMELLPDATRRSLQTTMDATAANKRMTLTLALSYGSRQDITAAMQQLGKQVAAGNLKPEDITEADIKKCLTTADMPDPELLIRTSGEMRVSNFLLWELAYTELYITPVLWPDFRRKDLLEAIAEYQKRERRFGKTSEQLKGA